MREFGVAPKVSLAPSGGLADSVFDGAAEDPGVVVFGRKVDGGWRDVTAAEFAAEVLALAKGLVASGIEIGDRVGIMSRTVYEWTLFDYARCGRWGRSASRCTRRRRPNGPRAAC